MKPTKRMESTLAPIPAKTSRFMSTTNNATNANRPPRIGANNAMGMLTAFNNKAKRAVGQSTRPTATRTATPSTTQVGVEKKAISASANSTSVSTTGAGKPINKRIPPYDFKARYNDLLEKHKALKEKFEDKCELIGNLESMPEQLEDTQNQLIATQNELKNTQTMKEYLERQVKLQNEKIDTFEAQLSKTQQELKDLTKIYTVCTLFFILLLHYLDLRWSSNTFCL